MVRKKIENKDTQEKKVLTRAQKTDATKAIVTELLAMKPIRHNELIEEVAKTYVLRHEGADTENPNDVKGRVGSVLDIMKKNGDIAYDGGAYALKARLLLVEEEKEEEKPAPKKKRKTKKAETPVEGKADETAENTLPPVEEKPAPKKRGRPKKTESTQTLLVEEATPSENEAASPAEGRAEEAPAKPKKARTAKAKTKKIEKEESPVPTGTPIPTPVQAEEKPVENATQKTEPLPTQEEKPVEKAELAVLPKGEVAPKSAVMDMSFLFGVTPPKAVEQKTEKPVQKAEKKEEKPAQPVQKSVERKVEEKPTKKEEAPAQKTAAKPAQKVEPKAEQKPLQRAPMRAASLRPLTEDEKLRDSFLKRMRLLSGEYFEYYSVYLLQRYSMKNGRRLESMRVSGGDRDGGIDGEIELTDKLGFRETIYIQSKNWDPEKGREDNWVVGETLLQQFIGACVCRQAKDGRQHARGIFITTSRFTPDAKRILDTMSEKIVGYDGEDLYEAAKECQFGVVKKNGKWELDENLLAGTKAFFQTY